MNDELAKLLRELGWSAPEYLRQRLSFGLACATRVEHLLEDPRAKAGLDVLRRFVAGTLQAAEVESAAAQMQRIANRHGRSHSIDGAAHAAVSATYAVANALAGKALEAANYAAYAAVYAYGGYAVNDPSAYEQEFDWQVAELRALAAREGHAALR